MVGYEEVTVGKASGLTVGAGVAAAGGVADAKPSVGTTGCSVGYAGAEVGAEGAMGVTVTPGSGVVWESGVSVAQDVSGRIGQMFTPNWYAGSSACAVDCASRTARASIAVCF